MQIVADMTDKAGLSLPITGAIKELVKDARRLQGDERAEMDGKLAVGWVEFFTRPNVSPLGLDVGSRKRSTQPTSVIC